MGRATCQPGDLTPQVSGLRGEPHGSRERAWSTAGHVMRCNLLKVVVDGETLAMWALIGESRSAKSTLGMPPGLGDEGGGTRVFRWRATLG